VKCFLTHATIIISYKYIVLLFFNLVLEQTWYSSSSWTLQAPKIWTLTWLHQFSLLLQQSFPLVVYRLLLLFFLLVMNHSPLTFILLLQPSTTLDYCLPTCLLCYNGSFLWFHNSSQTLSQDCSSIKHSTSNFFKIIKHKFLILEDANETLLVRPRCVLLCWWLFHMPLVYVPSADMTSSSLNPSICHGSSKINWLWVLFCHLCLLKCCILSLIAIHPMICIQLLKLLLFHPLTHESYNSMDHSKTRGRMIALLVLICSKPRCYLMSLLLLVSHCPWKTLTSIYFVDWEENFRT